MGVCKDRYVRTYEGAKLVASGTNSMKVGDSFRKIEQLADNSVQLVVTSPPYNLGKSYEKKTSLSYYLDPYKEFISSLFKIVSPTGSVCWQVGNTIRDGAVFPLDIYFYPLFIDAGFQLKSRIIWHFRHGLHAQKRLSGRYETILWFSKCKNPTFNLDPIRIPALYPGKTAFKGPRKGLPTGHPAGKNPSDFWPDVLLEEWETAIWDFPNVKANHPEKTFHPCQYPVELAERCVLALSDCNDLVFDPFLGVGSTAIAASRHGRRFLGFDFNSDYVAMARSRLKLEKAGKLLTRKLGTEIHRPSGRVSRRPDEWN